MNLPGSWMTSDSPGDYPRSESAHLCVRLVLAIACSREAMVDREPFGDPIGWHFLGGGAGVHPSLDQSSDLPESDDCRSGRHPRRVLVPAADGPRSEPRTTPRRIGIRFPSRGGQGRKSHYRRAPGCTGDRIECNSTYCRYRFPAIYRSEVAQSLDMSRELFASSARSGTPISLCYNVGVLPGDSGPPNVP